MKTNIHLKPYKNENVNLINILPHKDQNYSQITEIKINGEKINPT